MFFKKKPTSSLAQQHECFWGESFIQGSNSVSQCCCDKIIIWTKNIWRSCAHSWCCFGKLKGWLEFPANTIYIMVHFHPCLTHIFLHIERRVSTKNWRLVGYFVLFWCSCKCPHAKAKTVSFLLCKDRTCIYVERFSSNFLTTFKANVHMFIYLTKAYC